ncbi:MAG: hydroxymethylbilane synthase [Rhodobacteraceae bacterium]|nr:hydroxymethylbilane synthase [Paracoccaceae bacterium]
MAGKALTGSGDIRIGTRGSRLALVQAEIVRRLLVSAHGLDDRQIEIVPITTRGDRELGRPLHEIGGKGLFCGEIETQLTNGNIDMAVHSLKDMPAVQPDGLVVACIPCRGDPRDALISERHRNIRAIPSGTRVGTSSTRRRAQLLHLNSSLEICGFRGNVETRLRKLAEGQAEATMLAVEGLCRSGLADARMHPVPVSDMLPSPAQAAICVETRMDDFRATAMLAPLNDKDSHAACSAERAFLKELDGDCTTPIGALAVISGNKVALEGELLDPEGTLRVRDLIEGSVDQPQDLGRYLADRVQTEFCRRAGG